MSFLAKLLESDILKWFLSKKKIISFVAGRVMAALAGLVGMQTAEFKDAVCSAPIPPAPSEVKLQILNPPPPAVPAQPAK